MNRIAEKLKEAGIENYLFEARIIEEHAAKNNLDATALVNRRITREPLQYIIGEWEFYGDVYKLNNDCLIPRPETEFLTEYIINNARKDTLILDLCSGSGCISISALKRREDLRAILVDISKGAVDISKENAQLNGVAGRTAHYCFDVMNNVCEICELVKDIHSSDILIACNPPYLTLSEVQQVQNERTEVSHEPEAALLGGDDGLDFYRFITEKYKNICSEIVFECGINQYETIIAIFQSHGFDCTIIKDYAKIERIIAAKKSHK